MKLRYYEETETLIAIAKDDVNFNISGVKAGTRYWDEVQEAIASGEVIAPYVAPPDPPARTDKQRLEDATGLTIAKIRATLA